jgi:hypothetical protein
MEVDMVGLLLALLVIWVVLSIIGFVVKGLIWLAVIGVILFLGTAAISFVRRKTIGR